MPPKLAGNPALSVDFQRGDFLISAKFVPVWRKRVSDLIDFLLSPEAQTISPLLTQIAQIVNISLGVGALMTSNIGTIELEVSNINETDVPPDVVGLNVSPQQQFLQSRVYDFGETAREIAALTKRFLRYHHFLPLTEVDWTQAFLEPKWKYCGRPLVGMSTSIFPPYPVGDLGSINLTQDKLPDLKAYVEDPTDPSIGVELLSDAQIAWFDGSLRRSILELAICSEVLVKRKFISSPVGAQYAFLENGTNDPNTNRQVKVIDLLDKDAKHVFRRSFKEDDKSNFTHIDHLFRCRNKVAHRNQLIFRDDGGKTHNVESSYVKEWWEAVLRLTKWLDSL